MTERFDLVVIGGGINGAAVARDAAGRGLSVLLAEANDYAGATSSASSKLIHGGIRYLEQYEFRLVRESLRERETLMAIAPHLVFPLEFLVPITQGQPRPAWMVRLGLFLYDVLSGRRLLAKSGRVPRPEWNRVPRLKQERLKAILHYPDCWTDDARLTLETLLDARKRGADIRNYRPVTRIAAKTDGFDVTYREDGRPVTVHARFVVNAGGPFATDVMRKVEGMAAPARKLRLVRGSHIVLPMPAPVEHRAFTLQNDDKRVVFVIPWMERFLIVGTTDVPHEEAAAKPRCTDAERDYLLDCYHRFFDHRVGPEDVLWSWSGIRPLVDDGEDNPSKVTREYELVTARRGKGALVSIYGGKITTHRKLGELVMAELRGLGADMGPSWTRESPIHGGEMSREALAALAEQGPEEIPLETRRRWVFTYGAETRTLYEMLRQEPALARPIGIVPEAELVHAVTVEDARTAEDFLYRRTKVFMLMDQDGIDAVNAWFAQRRNPAGP
ncbi:glycerol-3-phosphate dehydrogenase [Zavarzinia compransoris]|uniref:glycerol-3-phosphate dehydrogenase n=1 Tax=Zavarzinia marina TaxID=2911065 RepID=UPI001F1699F1|nr:glycerol-3-phosphate dehydrogenase [Zavarzinia marina]MCF4165494.1 glycerol-3-phosphate dehydrogenase [Zavarzinia marina]